MVKKITINLDEDTYKQLRYYSFESGKTMAQVIRQGIVEQMKMDFKPTLERVKKILDNPTEVVAGKKIKNLANNRGELNADNYTD